MLYDCKICSTLLRGTNQSIMRWLVYDRLYRAIVRAIRRHLRPEVEEDYSRRFNDSNVEYSKRTYQ